MAVWCGYNGAAAIIAYVMQLLVGGKTPPAPDRSARAFFITTDEPDSAQLATHGRTRRRHMDAMLTVLGRVCRVRARIDPCPRERRPRPRQDARSAHGEAPEDDALSEAGNSPQTERRRIRRRSYAFMRRQPCRHLPNDGLMYHWMRLRLERDHTP